MSETKQSDTTYGEMVWDHGFIGSRTRTESTTVWIPREKEGQPSSSRPGGLVGLVMDFWQRGLTDLGWFGPNARSGGTFVSHGSETPRDAVPEIKGAVILRSETSNIWTVMRFIDLEDQPLVGELQEYRERRSAARCR